VRQEKLKEERGRRDQKSAAEKNSKEKFTTHRCAAPAPAVASYHVLLNFNEYMQLGITSSTQQE
jgi:hypothetical protein